MTGPAGLRDSDAKPAAGPSARCWACGAVNEGDAERCKLCDRRDWRELPARVKSRIGTLATAWQAWDDREPPETFEPERPGFRFEMAELMGIVALVAGVLTLGRYSVGLACLLGFWGVPVLLTWHRAGRRRRERRPLTVGEVVAEFATMVALVLGVLCGLMIVAGLVIAYAAYVGLRLVPASW